MDLFRFYDEQSNVINLALSRTLNIHEDFWSSVTAIPYACVNSAEQACEQ